MMKYDKLLDFYCEHMKNNLMPFWVKAFDYENGGVFTCFTNNGSKLLSTDKYIWSQGRAIWILSKLAEEIDKGYLDGNKEFYLKHACKTYNFVLKNAILEKKDGVCAYLVTREGQKKKSVPGKGYYTSFFVDCFVIMGFVQYARSSGNRQPLEDALSLYDRMMEYLNRGEIVSEPFSISKGYVAHSVSMIMCNVTLVLWQTLNMFGHIRTEEIRQRSVYYANDVFNHFYCEKDGVIFEMLPINPVLEDTMLARHILPGHTFECMWFCAHIALANRMQVFDKIFKVVKNTMKLGWDLEFGGLLRYVDYKGGMPRGREINDSYEQLIKNTWDTKLWWPHSEALYTTLLCYWLSKDEEFLALYKKTHQYIFEFFPNPDKNVGEWIQILDRQNKQVDKVVALPVKDPYHIVRDLLLIIELLNKIKKNDL